MSGKKIRHYLSIAIVCGFFVLSACSSQHPNSTRTSGSQEGLETQSTVLEEAQSENEELEVIIKQITIENQMFHLELDANETAEVFVQLFPITAVMEDLHQNEKYLYLSEELPTNPKQVETIEKGDVMLFGSDCLVIFYKGFRTSYSYTRIGKIREADALDFLADRNTIQIELN